MTALVTGVSRRNGIGYATACRIASYGGSVFCHHFGPHDWEQPWGGDEIELVIAGVADHLVGDARVGHTHADLTVEGEPERVLANTVAEFGRVDALVCNQALSGSDGPIGALTMADLDRHWAVNARASILLAQAFANHHRSGERGSIVFLTSGQGLGPMPEEVAYSAAKAAIAGITLTIADQLVDSGIRVNTVNPGPVDTGYLTPELYERVASKFPLGRFGSTDDPANLIAWLLTAEASWITGQIIHSEGGFGRWRPHR